MNFILNCLQDRGYVSTASIFSTVKSAEILCLSKIGYQPNCHVIYIAYGRFSAQFCLAIFSV